MSSHFYFVIAIMQFYLLAPLWRRLIKRLESPEWCVIILPLTLLIGQILGQYLPEIIAMVVPGYYFPYADRIFTVYIFWWTFGLVVGVHYDRIKAFAAKNLRPITVIFTLAAIFNAIMCYLHFSGRVYISWLETVHIFYVLTAVVFLYAFCVFLANTRLPEFSLISWIDRASYSIYLWHPLSLYIANIILGRMNAPSLAIKFALQMSFAYIGTLTVCIGVGLAVQKIKRK